MNIGHERMIAQRIVHRDLTTPEAVVRWFGAMQAQDYGQSLWAVGSRMPSATRATIEQAIADFRIVRTWPMRGTIHYVLPEDVRWLTALSAPRILPTLGRRQAELGLDLAMLTKVLDVFQRALEGRKLIRRLALLKILEDSGLSPMSGGRGYHALFYAAQNGLIFIGPMEKKEQTFGLVADFAPNPRKLDRAESLAELTRRYFTSHGPATVQDMAGWTGQTVNDIKAGIESVKNHLQAITIDKTTYYMAADQPESWKTDHADTLHALAGFDELVLGYRDRTAVIAKEQEAIMVPGANGVFAPFLVRDGRIIGVWKRVIKPKTIAITFTSFGIPITDAHFSTAFDRYSQFWGLPYQFDPGTVGDVMDESE